MTDLRLNEAIVMECNRHSCLRECAIVDFAKLTEEQLNEAIFKELKHQVCYILSVVVADCGHPTEEHLISAIVTDCNPLISFILSILAPIFVSLKRRSAG